MDRTPRHPRLATLAVAAGCLLAPPASEAAVSTNPTPINVPDGGAAAVYPSTIDMAGIAGNEIDVKVRLNRLTHERPKDLDIAVVGPTGLAVMLLSDDSNDAPTSNATLLFDDEGNRAPQLNEAIPSNTTSSYSPTAGASSDDNFPAPGPSVAAGRRFGSSMSTFIDESPHGSWKLFVKDDTANGKGGTIGGGWTLEIEGYELSDAECDADAGDLCGAAPDGVIPKFKLALTRLLRLRRLLRGLKVEITVPHPASTVKARLAAGRRLVASATKKNAGAGLVKLTLKPKRAGRALLRRRLSGSPSTLLRLSLVADPPGKLKRTALSKRLRVAR